MIFKHPSIGTPIQVVVKEILILEDDLVEFDLC